MAKKIVGHVELEWTCKRCGTKNSGTVKTCVSCGSLMAANQQFDLPAEQQLITDEEKLAQAAKGPDIHCPYCGTRNPGGSTVCTQCGGDLKDATARETGTILGAFQTEKAPDVICPACGSPNTPSASNCKNCGAGLGKDAASKIPAAASPAPQTAPKKGIWIGSIIIGVLLCVGLAAVFIMANRTSDTTGVVQSLHWERQIEILEQRPVEYAAWDDEIPNGAEVGACTEKFRHEQSEPAPGAEEVCGTPYTEDEGSGVGRVVQDCVYRVDDNWCSYTVEEWTLVDRASVQGSDLQPAWPGLKLQAGQSEGKRSEDYFITFIVEEDGKTYSHRVSSAGEFAQFAPNSRWILKINSFGDVLDVQPR